MPDQTTQLPAAQPPHADAPESQPPRHRHFDLGAGILAWVWPGLGHIKLGQRRRGWLIMIGILWLFAGGVLIGGVDCVDRQRDKLWFAAQAVCGPMAFATDYLNQAYTKDLPADWQQRYQRNDPDILAMLHLTSLGRVNEMGTLFSALAGLMNLIVILDALFPPARPASSGLGHGPLIERRKTA